MAELPRAPNDVGGMRRLEILPRTDMTLLHSELGVLAMDPSLELRWRHELADPVGLARSRKHQDVE
jgi:hypothetical protein